MPMGLTGNNCEFMEFQKIKQSISVKSPKERRQGLIDNMHSLIDSGKDCFSCQGFCCTFSYNSMRMTPLEALDMYEYLLENHLINEELITRLKDCVREYRLDKEIYLSNGRELRRQYTCPFFNAGPKGCGIALENKPYGCMAFNPLEVKVEVEGKCTSDQKILAEKELESSDEEMVSQKIKDLLELDWDKKPVPVALLSLIEKIS